MITVPLFVLLALLLVIFFGAAAWLHGRFVTRYSVAFHRLLRLLVVVGVGLVVLYIFFALRN
jgi:hypothetical protein